MKAAVFHQPGQPLSIQDIPTPTISSREMLVKVSHCGICGTDIHASKEGPFMACLLYTSPSPRDRQKSRMPSSA